MLMKQPTKILLSSYEHMTLINNILPKIDKCEKIRSRVLHHIEPSLRKILFLMGIHLIELLRHRFLEPSRILSYRRGFKQPKRKFKQPSNMSK
jgi:hypothetical protein